MVPHHKVSIINLNREEIFGRESKCVNLRNTNLKIMFGKWRMSSWRKQMRLGDVHCGQLISASKRLTTTYSLSSALN